MDQVNSKSIWRENDFSSMDFHDVRIYSIEFVKEHFALVFDIDYIFEWKLNKETNLFDQYDVASALLKFDNYTELEMKVNQFSTYDLIIESISQGKGMPCANGTCSESKYIIELNNGNITFLATGFSMELTSKIMTLNMQEIGIHKRNNYTNRHRL